MAGHDAGAGTVRLQARADCRYADGSVQRLWATRIKLSSAWIVAVEPPRVGELIDLVLHPLGLEPLPPIRARVMKSQIDFSVVEKNGFEVAFLEVDETTLDLLVNAVIGIDAMRKKAPVFAERRGALRVKTDFQTLARISGESQRGMVADLSLTGALLALPPEVPEDSAARGAAVVLVISVADLGEPLEVEGRIRWSTLVPAQRLVGIQFENVSSKMHMRIQETILQTLTRGT
jgi:hypothetical protein